MNIHRLPALIKTALLICLLASSANTLYAQNAKVIGVVNDQLTGKPIEYASVTIYRNDSVFVDGAVTKSDGHFTINKLKAGHYYLKAQFIGYTNSHLSNLVIIGAQQLNVGIIKLIPNSRYLSEVKVTGQKATIFNKIDKQVYKADQFQSAKGGNAIDVIKNMPSVTVNSQGEISMRGSSGFLVLINGKPVQVDAETILSQLPANAIENIEVITSPSAKYDADGKAGIINITTKKGANDGFSVALNAQGGLPSVHDYHNKNEPVRFGGDATFNYKVNQWDISVGGNYLRNDIAGERSGDVSTIVNNRYTTFPSEGERSFVRHNYAVRANITYSPDKNNNITAGFYNGNRTQYRLAELLYNNTKTDLNTGKTIGKITYFNSNLVKRDGDFTLGNLDYNHLFNNKSNLSVSGLFEHDLLSGFTNNRNLNYPDITTLMQHTINTNSNPLNGYRLQADYTIPIGPGKLESGYLFRYQKQTGNFLSQTDNTGNGNFITDYNHNTDVINTVNAVYTQYGATSGKLQYTAGLRYEYSTRNFSADDTQGLYKLNLSNLFPSANLLYTLDQTWKAKAGYSRRVQRTNFNELNPYPEREHSETEELGDPNLLPEFVNLEELGLIKTLKQGSIFITFYHQDITNAINRVNKVITDTILYRIYTNAGKAHSWGAELGGDIKITKWWQFYLGANLYNYSIKGSLFDNSIPVNNTSFNYSFNGNTNIRLSSNSSIQFNINYLSARATAQGKDSRFITPNSSFKHSFIKGRLTAMLQWQNMDLGLLHTNQQRITTFGSNFYTSTNYIQETDIFLLNMSFNLNQLSKKPKLPTSEFGDREF